MKISNIKVNGFGKLENKEITFNDGINLITGDNESGKSTLSKCIQSMFFGVSRNKNGKSISDYDKYKPWNEIPFSAKIEYKLDDGEHFEVFRDFSKRNTKIYNSNLEDISNKFSVDKSKNSNFFVEQTNISEDVFMKTAIVQQQEVRLNKLEQNVILQKVSNLVSTGDDTVSFKKIMDKLNKKQLDEVGTQRSSERPLNIVLAKIENCKSKLQDIDYIKSKESSITNDLNNLKKCLQDIENEISLLKELQNIRNNERVEASQIDAVKKIISEYDDKINTVKKNLDELKAKNSKKKKMSMFFGFLFVIFTILFFVLSLPLPSITISVVLFALTFYFYTSCTSIVDTKSVLLNAKKEKEEELNILVTKFEKVKLSSNDYIRGKYGNTNFLGLSYEEISSLLAENEKNYSEKMLQFNTLTVNRQNALSQIDDLACVKEEFDDLNDELNQLNSLNNSINIAKEALNEAYEEMKNSITPEFTNYLSGVIANVSDNKYNQVKFNDEDGLIVELSNGDYINCDLLSIGTIDQMYIALRLATLKQVSNESLPIIFDEAFVYFDNDRLENILEFLSNEFNQIIIFSCSNREKVLLDNLGINYTEIEL